MNSSEIMNKLAEYKDRWPLIANKKEFIEGFISGYNDSKGHK